MAMRYLKKDCYIDTLEESLTNVQMICNHLQQIDQREDQIPTHILRRDRIKTILHLELALASYSVLLRKMHENNLIDYDEEIHNDINSIIHSNRFEYFEHRIVVYSKRGKENVNLPKLLEYGQKVITKYREENVNRGKRFSRDISK